MTTKYKYDPETDTQFWINAFTAMSSQWFETFQKELSFPVTTSDELIDVSRDFTVNYLNHVGIPIPEFLTHEYTNASISNDNDDYLLELWVRCFTRLESFEYALPLYTWGKSQQTLENMFHKRLGTPSEWAILLIDWSQDPEDHRFLKLNLPGDVLYELQLIVLRHYTRYQRARIHIHRAERSHKFDKNEWNEFVFSNQRIGPWIANMVWLNTQKSKWSQIARLLSKEQLTDLENWGYKIIESRNPKEAYFSIVELAMEILHL